MSRLVKPIEYAKEKGISRQAVYAKIKKGLLLSKTIEGKIYIILDESLSLEPHVEIVESSKEEERKRHLIDVQELLSSKDETIGVLKESISDLKQTNTEINTTLRGEIELLKQVFSEMRNLYVKQVDYMSAGNSNEKEEVLVDTLKIPNDEEECWITLDDFFARSNIFKEKKKNKIVKRLKKSYKKADKRVKIEGDEIYLSCYHFYEDILSNI